MRFEEIIPYLEARTMMPERPPSLDSTRRALQAVGLLATLDAKKNIIVAGTNGKGTVCATLSRLLHAAGRRVGLYTSPHLVCTTERFRIAENDITREDFVAAFNALSPWIESEKLTHFEALTVMAAWLFFSGERVPAVDYAIWEVGLGGRLDATNAIPHHLCGITRLGLDHQNLLGSTLDAIAAEKFGVVPPDGRVVFSPLEPAVLPVMKQVQQATRSQWRPATSVRLRQGRTLETPWGVASLALEGERAAENTATALTLFEELGFDPASHLPSLQAVRWPGRFERVMPREWPLPCPLYVSGDHNPQGVESLLAILRSHQWNNLHLVVGIAVDKDAERMFDRLLSLPRTRLYLTETPFKPRRLENYPQGWRNRAVAVDVEVSRLLRGIAAQARPDDLILVTGSLYLVGKVLAFCDAWAGDPDGR